MPIMHTSESSRTFQITIEGVSPLMMDRLDPNDLGKDKPGKGKREEPHPLDAAEKKLYKHENGTIYLPTNNILSCIMGGGEYFKQGMSKITTRDRSLIPACVEMHTLAVDLISLKGWTLDSRIVWNGIKKVPIVAHRPMFHDWKVTFTLDLDTELLSPKLLREIVDSAGKRVGLGAYRPSRKGPYGRFVVTEWKEINKAA